MSISTALAMTFMGARGETASQMSQVLHFNILKESVLHQSFADLSALISRADAPYTLKAANRLFGKKGLDVLATFVDDSKKYYGASMETLDFICDGEGSRQHINSWVEKQTANRIKDLLPAGSIDALTRLVLVNAIYFKGQWTAKFKHHGTFDEKFRTVGGYVNVPMMHQRGKFNYARDDSVRSSILELPYIKNEVSMFIVLPDQVDGLADVQQKLSPEKIDSWVRETRIRNSPTVALSLPKFILDQDFILNDVLKAMGMPDPFDQDRADFSGMTGDKDLFISKVIHKAFLDVNEEGSEAAAATAVVMQAPTSCMPARTLEFKADHPFLVFICDNKTGAILFIGQLCKPEGDTIMGDSPSEKGMGSGGNVLGNTCLCPPPPPPLPCP
ncbi:leukocyte elastase inhibitor A-like isoform X3 [Patiria miniata]|uniref:Serpin domain-containing protein n=1 Tax=Patiria miniata TaxID=46514 RepID=A0A913ZEM4_PATMI|nr:leukocyte elastase inhibitor A-like isoform X3 [Patiria miniata]